MVFSSILSYRRKREKVAYNFVAKEIAEGLRDEGLWLKAMSDANFDQPRAKSIYVKLRVQSIIDDFVVSSGSENTPQSPKDDGKGRSHQNNTLSPRSDNFGAARKDNTKAKARLEGVVWMASGILAYQAFGWFMLGQKFTLGPIEFLSNIFYSLLIFGSDFMTTAILAVQFGVLLGLIFKGLRVFRSGSKAKTSSISLSKDS